MVGSNLNEINSSIMVGSNLNVLCKREGIFPMLGT